MLEKGIIIVADSGNTLGLLIDYPVKYENVIFVLALNNLTLIHLLWNGSVGST